MILLFEEKKEGLKLVKTFSTAKELEKENVNEKYPNKKLKVMFK